MARIFIDGFENGDLGNWSYAGRADLYSSSLVSGFKGVYNIFTDRNSQLAHLFSPSLTTLKMAFKICRQGTDDGAGDIIRFKDSATTVCLILLLNSITSKLEVHLGEYNGTLLASGNTAFVRGETRLIEIAYTPLNSGGTITVKMDGVQELTYTGDTTAGLENISIIHFGDIGGNSGRGVEMCLDDVVVDDINWIGNTYIQKGQVSGAGTTTQFTPSGAVSNYECVDEIPYSDTDFNYSNTIGHIDSFAISPMTGAVSDIKSVQLEARISYEGTPTPTHVQLGVRSGGTDYFDTDISPALSFGKTLKILELNPNGNVAWTEETVNSMEIGYKVTA